MNKQELAELIRDRDDMVSGRVAPVRSTEVVFAAATGMFVRWELDPESCRREFEMECACGNGVNQILRRTINHNANN